MQTAKKPFPLHERIAAWTVHLFTALAAVAGFFTLVSIYNHDYMQALWLMAIAVFIDAIDGTFARMVRIKSVLPSIDGALLDNMVDYLNYVITPMFFIYIKPDMLPQQYSLIIVAIVILTSAYQFCQSDAKTPDHFFKGFPCYWNIALFYMFIFETSAGFNAWVLFILSILIFVPIKYVYPSRLQYLTDSKGLKLLMHAYSALFGLSLAILLWQYPNTSIFWLSVSLSYAVVYLYLSIYRTYYPMIKSKIKAKKNHAQNQHIVE
ncbi:phosphatidylcholine/phosphatidylserine synthase [Legionella sp. W05-934-2]|jgi:phosphatidylcholine synthase|uniref:CDP-alcohol phosphatidyltransferase family protein n=1 Tax=Legionella sp. W05-934-2 TaxID=1198649 RepID=UPI0034617D2C